MENQRKWPAFRLGEKAATILENWWKDLSPKEKAELRRCDGPAQVVFNPAYHRLLNGLRNEGYGVDPDALALVVGLSGHIRNILPLKSFGKQMASGPDEKAQVSELRFRRLLEIKEREDLYVPLIRVLHLLAGNANFLDLADSVYGWNERTRKRWAGDYYAGFLKSENNKEEAVS